MRGNQLQYFGVIDFCDRLWGMERNGTVTSKPVISPKVSPWLVEPGCSTPTRFRVATVSNNLENSTYSLCFTPKLKLTTLSTVEYFDPI